MSYPYPTTINGSAGIPEFLTYVNSVTDGWISNMLLLGIYLLILIGFYKTNDDFAGAMGVSGFITFVIGLMFWLGDFINGVTFGIIIAMALIGVIVLLVSREQ